MRELCTLNAPVTSDLDIYRSAKLLIDRHGEHTLIQAAMRADAMLGNGDMDGKRVWVRIMKAIEELQRQEDGYSLQHGDNGHGADSVNGGSASVEFRGQSPEIEAAAETGASVL